jgi:hypothetical protein
MQANFLGVLPDTRSPQEKENAILHSEIFGSSVPTYLADKTAASTYVGMFPIDDQQGTSSCVAHGKVLALSIFFFLQGVTKGVFVQLASMFIYRNRVNYPGEGMIPASADTQVEQSGAPQYGDMPTPATEDEANALPVPDPATTQAAKLFSGVKWVTLVDPTDIDTMAFVANSLNLPLNILIYATEAEWSQADVDIITQGLTQDNPTAIVRHCITILPKSAFTDPSITKRVIIQDSADFGGIYFRTVSADFIAARVYECAYPISLDNTPVLTKPSYTLNADLTIGSTGADVTALQEILQYMGYLPNVVNGQPFAPTGYYGGMTKAAVLQLQNEYAAEILTPAGLTAGTGYCGSSTRGFLNKLFSA